MMARADDEVLGFVAEWYDPMPQITKQYLLRYWPGSHMVEMLDLKVTDALSSDYADFPVITRL